MNAISGGERVEILTSGGEIDPFTYNVTYVKENLVGLTCQETGISISVNNHRISRILKKENVMRESNTATIEEAVIEAPDLVEIEDQPTTATPTKTKELPLPINFDQLVNDGFEVWTKMGLNLGDDPKVAGIQVAAHCVIDPEGTQNRGFEVFNSYNGTRGKKGNAGKRYSFNDKMSADKKRKQLEKKGYTQHTV